MNNFDYYAYIGTYTSGGVITPKLQSKGIYILGYDSSSGTFSQLGTAFEKDNPSFLAISPNGKNLYSVGEIDDKRGGALSAYSINDDGSLSIINTISSIPISTASSTAYWTRGLSIIGSISFGVAFDAGRNLVPRPATGKTAFLIISSYSNS